MLCSWHSHQYYQEHLLSSMTEYFQSNPQLVLYYEDQLNNLYDLNLDPIFVLVADRYSSTGAPAKLQAELFRSFFLTFPTAVEFMQRQVIEAAEEYLGLHFPDKSASAYLLLTFDGNSQQELDQTYQKATDICLECGALDVFISNTEERQESIWKARGAFLEAIRTSTSDMDECDVVVSCTMLSEFMTFVNTLERNHGLRIRNFGHAGDGNLHIYLCKDDLSDAVWYEKCGTIMGQLYTISTEMGGQISGEHGIGHAKYTYLKQALGDKNCS